MKRKNVSIVLLLLLVGTYFTPSMAQDSEKLLLLESRGNWLYVGGNGPGNFTSIQAAVHAASDDDTIFVYDDSSPYDENIIVDKSLYLLGENKNTTIIENSIIYGDIVSITADNVTIEGFTVRQQGGQWTTCIAVHANDSWILNNIIKDSNDHIGLSLTHSGSRIVGNRISGNEIGIEISGSNHTISENTIKNNNIGVDAWSGSNNLIYHNYFIDNYRDDAMDGGDDAWNGDFLSGGNYWDDFYASDDFWGPNQDINGSDGIFDWPCRINGEDPWTYDYYPLKYPYGTTQLYVKFTPKSFGSILSIKNFPSSTAFNVHWSMTLNGGKLICPREYSGIVKPIPPNDEVIILPGFFFIGIGSVEICISAWAENAPMVSKTITGILFLFFFFTR